MITTYCPEDVEIWVDNKRIGGLSENFFMGDSDYFKVSVSVFSEDLGYLMSKVLNKTNKPVDVFIDFNLKNGSSKIKHFNIDSKYNLHYHSIDFKCSEIPVVEFGFYTQYE